MLKFIIVVIAALAFAYYAIWQFDDTFGEDVRGPEPVACTTDAKICPDGSAVGRTGPNCEFAACPGE